MEGLRGMPARTPTKDRAVGLANKTARIVWAMMGGKRVIN
jgi:hypothetical protein